MIGLLPGGGVELARPTEGRFGPGQIVAVNTDIANAFEALRFVVRPANGAANLPHSLETGRGRFQVLAVARRGTQAR